MLDIVVLIFFVVMTYRIIQSVRLAAPIFAEYNQSRALALLVLLFPLGPLVLLAGPFLMPFPLPPLIAALCYIPVLLTARQQSRVFDTAGTDRVQKAHAVATQAFGVGLVGLIYVAVYFAFALGVGSID